MPAINDNLAYAEMEQSYIDEYVTNPYNRELFMKLIDLGYYFSKVLTLRFPSPFVIVIEVVFDADWVLK
nr:hypothetical protein [Tanacetum cinerariifolium]